MPLPRSRFYESSQAMPTYRSYFDQRFNDTHVGFMKQDSDYHVILQHRVDQIRWTRAWRWRNGKLRASQVTVGMLAYRCCADS